MDSPACPRCQSPRVAEVPDAPEFICSECGLFFERVVEVERPSLTTPAVPAFKELPVPELVPNPAPEAVSVPPKRASWLKIAAAVVGVATILQSVLVPGTIAHTVVKFVAGLGSIVGIAG